MADGCCAACVADDVPYAYTCGTECSDTPCDCPDTLLARGFVAKTAINGLLKCDSSHPYEMADGCCAVCKGDDGAGSGYECAGLCSDSPCYCPANETAQGFVNKNITIAGFLKCDGTNPYENIGNGCCAACVERSPSGNDTGSRHTNAFGHVDGYVFPYNCSSRCSDVPCDWCASTECCHDRFWHYDMFFIVTCAASAALTSIATRLAKTAWHHRRKLTALFVSSFLNLVVMGASSVVLESLISQRVESFWIEEGLFNGCDYALLNTLFTYKALVALSLEALMALYSMYSIGRMICRSDNGFRQPNETELHEVYLS